MAWIKIEQSLPAHRKVLLGHQLAAMDRFKYIGHLVTFWTWALDQAKDDGLLPALPDDLLGEMAGLPRRQGRVFINSLKETAFIDVRDGGYYLHDWDKYAGQLYDRRRKDADRKAEARQKENGKHADNART